MYTVLQFRCKCKVILNAAQSLTDSTELFVVVIIIIIIFVRKIINPLHEDLTDFIIL